jgi:hypothetical protein
MTGHFFPMDVEFLYRIGAMAFGLVLAWGLMNAATWRQRRAARTRRDEVTRANPGYWSRPARIRRRRKQAR